MTKLGREMEARVGVGKPRADMDALAISMSCVGQRQENILRFGQFPGFPLKEQYC
jgi:hypothetical protein